MNIKFIPVNRKRARIEIETNSGKTVDKFIVYKVNAAIHCFVNQTYGVGYRFARAIKAAIKIDKKDPLLFDPILGQTMHESEWKIDAFVCGWDFEKEKNNYERKEL